MRISTSYVGMNQYTRLYRVDILIGDQSACYFRQDEEPKFIEPSADYIISAHWENEPKNEKEAQDILKITFSHSQET